jgi:hypothetical protein
VSKLTCAACGHVIFDQSDYLPHKGELVKDQDAFDVWTALETDIADYVRTVRGGSESARRAWVAARLPGRLPADADDEHVISALVLARRRRYVVELFECHGCGRLWVERAVGANRFVGFAPDSGRVERALASQFGGVERERG